MMREPASRLSARSDRVARLTESPLFRPDAARPLNLDHWVIRLDALQFGLQASHGLRDMVTEAFAHLAAEGPVSGAAFVARASDHRVDVMRRDSHEWSSGAHEFVPRLKARLVEEVLATAPYEVALHAGAYAKDGGLLLLVGPPGAGKTTLGLALARSGFDLAADDVALVHADGWVGGLPLAPAVKEGAWPLVAQYWPACRTCATHVRPDGQRVRYVVPGRSMTHARGRIRSVVVLDRREGAPASAHAADPVVVLGKLLAEATSRDERLSAAGFSALIDALDGARCCTLTYSDLDGAVRVVREFHR
jgi:hypothetical protein